MSGLASMDGKGYTVEDKFGNHQYIIDVCKSPSSDCKSENTGKNLLIFFCAAIAYNLRISVVLGGLLWLGQLKKHEHIMTELPIWWQHLLLRVDIDSDVLHYFLLLVLLHNEDYIIGCYGGTIMIMEAGVMNLYPGYTSLFCYVTVIITI